MTTEQRLSDLTIAIATDIKDINQRIATYTHTQSIPDTNWVINHNLGKIPTVTVVDSAGTEVVCGVEHISTESLEVKSAFPFSGKAYLK